MNGLEDKLSELTKSKSVFGFDIHHSGGEFTIQVHLRGKDAWPSWHHITIGPYPNLHQAVDEALIVLREHLSDCSLC